MKRSSLMFVVLMTLLTGLAAAQMSNTPLISAQVPFAFVAANHTVPAGQLVVRTATADGNILQIDSAAAKVGLFTPASVTQDGKAAGDYALVFHKQGDQYFLRGIKIGGSKWGYQLPESKAEAEMRARNMPSEEIVLASNK